MHVTSSAINHHGKFSYNNKKKRKKKKELVAKKGQLLQINCLLAQDDWKGRVD